MGACSGIACGDKFNTEGTAVKAQTSSTDNPSGVSRKSLFKRMNPLKMVFAMEYVLQGLANPFQGITYQPFYRHFRYDYGLSEAATQGMFSKS